MRKALFLSLLASLIATPLAQRVPVATATTHDFGRVVRGRDVVHPFRIANPRKAGPARVARVDLTAPGMSARFKPEVAAGESLVVTITWKTSALEGPVTAEGILRWTDATLKPVTLTLRGQVFPAIELQPMGAVFFSVFANEPAERVVRIVNHDSRPLTVRRIEPAGSHFVADLKDVERGRRFDLRVTVRSGLPTGRFQEKLTIHTDSPDHPVINVPVNVLIKPDLYANPELVEFGDVDLAAMQRKPSLLPLLTQTVIVKRREGTFEISKASTSVAGLVVKVSAGMAAAHRVDVSIDPGQLERRPLEGQIQLSTSDPRFPVLSIPVRGRIR